MIPVLSSAHFCAGGDKQDTYTAAKHADTLVLMVIWTFGNKKLWSGQTLIYHFQLHVVDMFVRIKEEL